MSLFTKSHNFDSNSNKENNKSKITSKSHTQTQVQYLKSNILKPN